MALKFTRVTGDAVTMRASAYGLGSRENRDADYSRLEDFSRNLRERSRSFIDNTRELLDVFYNDETRQLVRDARTVLKGIYRRNEHQFLTDYADIGIAPEVMRRFIVAHPRLRELVRDQRCDGYGVAPAAWNMPARLEDDVAYRAVMRGVAVVPEDETQRCYTDYECGLDFELAEHGIERMSVGEQSDVLATYAVIDTLLDAGIDPTSKAGELL